MNTAKYILLAWFAFSAFITVSTVGKPRKPLEPLTAALSLVIFGGIAFLVVIA